MNKKYQLHLVGQAFSLTILKNIVYGGLKTRPTNTLLFFLIAIFLISCSPSINNENVAPTTDFFTATLPATNPPQATSTSVPPSPIATNQPIDGIVTTQLNVRSEPSTAGDTLGVVAAFSTVQILGKESNGAWYQIILPNSAEGKGWITATYVQVNVEIPVIQIGAGVNGIILQGVNVRNGAGRDNTSLGTLVQNDVVLVNGQDSSGDWIQIQYKGNVGWIASEFVRVNAENLFVIAQADSEESTSQESEAGTLSNAMQDNDSLEQPIASAILSGALQFTGFVSSLNADEIDWIQFRTFSTKVMIEVQCSESDLQLDLYKGNSLFSKGFIICEETKTIFAESNQIYTIKLTTTAETLKITSYSVLLKNVK